MTTPLVIERRLATLEAHALAPRPTSRRVSLPTLGPDAVRAVLAMLIEIGALTPPPPSQPDRWRELLRHALYGPDGLPAARDTSG